MMTWHLGPFTVLDTETTGVDVETDRIVTAAVIDVLPPGSEPTSRTSTWLINPGIEIPAGATAIHRITTEQARQHGQSPVSALAEIAGRICVSLKRGVPVVAMNAPFDLTMLDRELIRHDLGSLAERLGGYDRVRPVLDPMVLDRHYDKYRKGKRTLQALCDEYGVVLTEAHAADGDALGAVRVLWAIAQRHPELAAMDPQAVHNHSVVWRAEQQESLRAYFKRQGKPVDDIDTSWPVRPLGARGGEADVA
jgi:DNA polymerase-3 subunit epsilon